MKSEYLRYMDLDYYVEKSHDREFLLAHYYTIIIMLGILFTVVLNIFIKHTFKQLLNAFYMIINKAIMLSVLIVFIFSNSKSI